MTEPLKASPVDSSNAPYEGDAAQWARAVRKPLVWILSALVLGGPGACVAINTRGRAWQEQSTAYVRTAIPSICTTWDVEALRREAAPELLAAVPEAKLAEYFGAFTRRLGPLKEMSEPSGAVSFNIGTEGLQWFARYEIPAEFQQAKAVIQVQLAKEGGAWRITGFFVNSDALVP